MPIYEYECSKCDKIFEELQSFSTDTAGRKYEAVSTEEVISQQEHLTGQQKRRLKSVLDKLTTLFDGKLGCYTGKKVHLNLIDDFTPFTEESISCSFYQREGVQEGTGSDGSGRNN